MKRFKREPLNSRNESRRSKKRPRIRSDVRSVKSSMLLRMTVVLSILRDSNLCQLVPKTIHLARLWIQLRDF